MKISDKMSLADTIGKTLQERYERDEIGNYLAEFGIEMPLILIKMSNKAYAKQGLRGKPAELLLTIAEDLNLNYSETPKMSNSFKLPRIWATGTEFRLFISHISKDKGVATRLKEALAIHNISGFVAHEDIEPTLEWQDEIERGLHSMDAMVTVHTSGFSKSYWTQQEIGFALGRGAKVISFKMEEDPTGFISKQQALARRERTADEIAKEIVKLLGNDPRTKAKLEKAG